MCVCVGGGGGGGEDNHCGLNNIHMHTFVSCTTNIHVMSF